MVYPLTIGPGFSIGTGLKITVPVGSSSSIDVNTRLTMEIWEGRYLIGTVAMIASYVSEEATIPAGGSYDFAFLHTAAIGPNWGAGQYRRDIKAFLDFWDGAGWVRFANYMWEDIYHVQAFQFEVSTPTVEAVS